MTLRQIIASKIYPLTIKITRLMGAKSQVLKNPGNSAPSTSFYNLKAIDISGKEITFDQFKGKKVLIVNTASDCGYTAQYSELQALHEKFQHMVAVLAFPANDFKEQEKGSDSDIAQFCQINFGVSFPLFKKTKVIKGPNQHPVFKWLSDSSLNGWNEQRPEWNFSKYLINEQGILTHYFGPSVLPFGGEIIDALNKR